MHYYGSMDTHACSHVAFKSVGVVAVRSPRKSVFKSLQILQHVDVSGPGKVGKRLMMVTSKTERERQRQRDSFARLSNSPDRKKEGSKSHDRSAKRVSHTHA